MNLYIRSSQGPVCCHEEERLFIHSIYCSIENEMGIKNNTNNYGILENLGTKIKAICKKVTCSIKITQRY